MTARGGARTQHRQHHQTKSRPSANQAITTPAHPRRLFKSKKTDIIDRRRPVAYCDSLSCQVFSKTKSDVNSSRRFQRNKATQLQTPPPPPPPPPPWGGGGVPSFALEHCTGVPPATLPRTPPSTQSPACMSYSTAAMSE